MGNTIKIGLAVAVILTVLAGGAIAAIDEITNFSGVHLTGSFATATPVFMVDEPSGGTGVLWELRAAQTPVARVDHYGKMVLAPQADDDAANYDNMVSIQYAMMGRTTKDRNWGLVIEGARPAGQELDAGDHDEGGLKIRVDTHAISTTTGSVLRAADIEAKVDNPGGTVYNLYGGSFTAKSDTDAGTVAGDFIGLTVNVQNNAAATGTLGSADVRLMRQAATEPTNEFGLRVRNSSTTGSGADSAIQVTSDYSATAAMDNWDYVFDANLADVNTAEIRGSNGETISNVTDGAWIVGGFTAPTRQSVIDLASGGTITCLGTYCPITNATGGSIDTSATTAIADGPVAGAIVIITNEDAQNVVIKDGANTKLSGDITLTGGAQDTITLIWDGSDWVGVSVIDN